MNTSEQLLTIGTMTRSQANEILHLWKLGAAVYTPTVIQMALYLTGDLDAHLE